VPFPPPFQVVVTEPRPRHRKNPNDKPVDPPEKPKSKQRPKPRKDKEEAKECPLCLETLDAVESNLYPCQSCKFQICLFCLNRLQEEASKSFGSCPGCRKAYPSDEEWKLVAAKDKEVKKNKQQRKDNRSQRGRRPGRVFTRKEPSKPKEPPPPPPVPPENQQQQLVTLLSQLGLNPNNIRFVADFNHKSVCDNNDRE